MATSEQAIFQQGGEEQKAQRDGSEQQTDYGVNFKDLPLELQSCLRDLVRQFANESPSARRDEVRRVQRAHNFWRGLQSVYWSSEDQAWRLPLDAIAGNSSTTNEDMPRYDFVTNIYQAFGLTLISVLSQDLPRVRLFPQSTQQADDVAYAKEGSTIIELAERNNRAPSLIRDIAFHMWTGGKVASYVRYVADGDRFGWTEEPEYEPTFTKFGEDVHSCMNCGTDTPASDFEQYGFCTTCGTELDPVESFRPAEMVPVPQVKQMVRVPGGQEVISILGALECKTPNWAQEQWEFPFIQWQCEAHKARLRSAYKHVAKKIGQNSDGGDTNAENERVARMNLRQNTGSAISEKADHGDNLITFQRTWLRSWAFWQIDDEAKREQLLQLFPDGCYVAFAGDVYCEARNESLDDHWRVEFAMPGDGQSRPALGDSLISVQERYNTLTNLEMESYEYGIPTTYADPEVLDFDAMEDSEIMPGAHYEAKPRPGQRLSDAFYTTQAGQVSVGLERHATELMGPIAQFLTGAFPALFGGNQGSNDTATGISIQRDQALGRIGLVWRTIKTFYADTMLLVVECFRENRPDDVEVPIFGKGGQFTSRWIRKANLKGGIFAYPETDENFPTLWGQQRDVLMTLMQSEDPLIQGVLGHPENLDFVKRLIGLPELVVPQEEARAKAHRTIDQLLEGMPVPQRDPMTGIEVALIPSIMPDTELDFVSVELDVFQRWLTSEEGQTAKVENPEGWANVRAYALVLKGAVLQEQMAAQAVQAEPQGATDVQ